MKIHTLWGHNIITAIYAVYLETLQLLCSAHRWLCNILKYWDYNSVWRFVQWFEVWGWGHGWFNNSLSTFVFTWNSPWIIEKNMISNLQFTFSILSLHIEEHRGDWILKFRFSSVPHSPSMISLFYAKFSFQIVEVSIGRLKTFPFQHKHNAVSMQTVSRWPLRISQLM